MKSNHIRKPKEYHVKCNTKDCTNYYSAIMKSSNGYCTPCNKKIRDKKYQKGLEELNKAFNPKGIRFE